eukprot:2328577-Lingulodinium_polyedra.AAC.1
MWTLVKWVGPWATPPHERRTFPICRHCVLPHLATQATLQSPRGASTPTHVTCPTTTPTIDRVPPSTPKN